MHKLGDATAARPRTERAPRRRLLGGALVATVGGLIGGLGGVGGRRPPVAAQGTLTTGTEPGFGVAGDAGRALWFLDGLVVWKALGADTAGRYELVEQQGAGGYAAPLHTHAGETEGFYVVQGDLTMVIGDLRFHAGPGAFGYVPIGVSHAFRVDSPTATFLTFITPRVWKAISRSSERWQHRVPCHPRDWCCPMTRASRPSPRSTALPSSDRFRSQT